MKSSKDQSPLEKFLEFNGKRISILRNDGEWWVAVKPICEALNVNYNRQFQNIKDDDILGSVFAIQQIQIPGDQGREMLCLPEKFVYGWLFSIRSESEELKQYKRVCYEVLYNHFHGALTGRMKILEERADYSAALEELEEDLKQSHTFKKIEDLKKKRTQATAALRKMDLDLTHGQLIFNF